VTNFLHEKDNRHLVCDQRKGKSRQICSGHGFSCLGLGLTVRGKEKDCPRSKKKGKPCHRPGDHLSRKTAIFTVPTARRENGFISRTCGWGEEKRWTYFSHGAIQRGKKNSPIRRARLEEGVDILLSGGQKKKRRNSMIIEDL